MRRGNPDELFPLSLNSDLAAWLQPEPATAYYLEVEPAPILRIDSLFLHSNWAAATRQSVQFVPWADTTPQMRSALQPVSPVVDEQGVVYGIAEYGFPGVSDYMRVYAIDCMLVNREWYIPLPKWENMCRSWAALPIKTRLAMTKRQDAVGIDTYLEAVGEQEDVQ